MRWSWRDEHRGQRPLAAGHGQALLLQMQPALASRVDEGEAHALRRGDLHLPTLQQTRQGGALMAGSRQEEVRGYRSYLRPGEIVERPAPPPEVVALADLAPARKRALWQWMQANDRATANYLAGLKNNPDVAELEAAFGPVRPVVALEYIRSAIG